MNKANDIASDKTSENGYPQHKLRGYYHRGAPMKFLAFLGPLLPLTVDPEADLRFLSII
jgi:hypothetical protein